MSSLLTCPKYIGYIIALSVFIDYQNHPVWNNWKWKVIMFFSLVNIVSICYKRYTEGLSSFSVIFDIIWLLLYLTILRFYGPKFDNATIVKQNINSDILRIGPQLKRLSGVGLALSIFVVLICICQFIPGLNVLAIPIMRVLSMFI